MWHNNTRVVRTHAKDGSQQAWAIVQAVSGWLRIRPSTADGTANILLLLSAALANDRRVDVFVQDGQIEAATLR